MKTFFFISTLFFVVIAQSSFNSYDEEWEKFKQNYFRNYNSLEEEDYRKTVFFKRLEEIEINNMKYELGLTPYENHIDNYADYTHAEIGKLHDFLNEIQQRVAYGSSKIPELKLSTLIFVNSFSLIALKILTL